MNEPCAACGHELAADSHPTHAGPTCSPTCARRAAEYPTAAEIRERADAEKLEVLSGRRPPADHEKHRALPEPPRLTRWMAQDWRTKR